MITPDPALRGVADLIRDRDRAPRQHPGAFVLSIDGSVAVGKSTTAAMLAQLLEAPPGALDTAVVSTDGFLFSNRVLDERGLTMRKGFPESYDRDALASFVDAVRDGRRELHVPVYSHDTYDVLPDTVVVPMPHVLVIEGLHTLGLAHVVDLSIYVDADEADIERWYTERFFELVAARAGFYAQFASMDDATATDFAHAVWEEINSPNLHEFILPNRDRADVVVRKGSDHAVTDVILRD
ncbi:MAG: hypothetical protein ABW073_04140 [Acidimicrobiia bacterium]